MYAARYYLAELLGKYLPRIYVFPDEYYNISKSIECNHTQFFAEDSLRVGVLSVYATIPLGVNDVNETSSVTPKCPNQRGEPFIVFPAI